MSYSSSHVSEHSQHSPQHHGRAPARRPHSAPIKTASSPHQRVASGYTLAHAGKQVRFGPVVFWIVVGTVTLLGAWHGGERDSGRFRRWHAEWSATQRAAQPN